MPKIVQTALAEKVAKLIRLATRPGSDGEGRAARTAICSIVSSEKVTKGDAVALAALAWWEVLDATEAALAQLRQPILCMPWSDYHRIVEDAVGAPVWTHEFVNSAGLIKRIVSGDTAPRDPLMTIHQAFAIAAREGVRHG